MADSVAAATPELNCSGDDFYEPLIGLRLGALFGILAVSSIGGTRSSQVLTVCRRRNAET